MTQNERVLRRALEMACEHIATKDCYGCEEEPLCWDETPPDGYCARRLSKVFRIKATEELK